jgi:predicted DNA-binding transcriptional regulator AlpA
MSCATLTDPREMITAELIDDKQLAALLGVHPNSVKNWFAQGKIGPIPIRISRVRKWRRAECLDWIAASCPPRNRWQAMREAAGR